MKRIFLAIELPDSLKEEVADIVSHCKAIVRDGVKWVENQNLHITLLFIGDVKDNDLADLCKDLDKMLDTIDSFYIDNFNIEAFPRSNPRLFWIKCDYSNGKIKSIPGKISSILQKKGYKIDDKEFRMHITIGRIKNKINAGLIEEIVSLSLSEQEREVDDITLYESRLHSNGPEYIELKKFRLQEVNNG